jgi:hypothetical protein
MFFYILYVFLDCHLEYILYKRRGPHVQRVADKICISFADEN